MLELRRATTADLTPVELVSIRALMDEAFGGRFDDHDWTHALGGVHVLGDIDGVLVGHASVVARTIWCGSTELRAGYVEAVAIRPGHQSLGYGGAIMAGVAEIIKAGYDIGALSAGERAQRLYARLGWATWLGPSYVEAPDGRHRTSDEDGAIMVLTSVETDLTAPIACAWRTGDVW